MKPAGQVIDVNFEELEALLERARQRMGEEDYGKRQAAIHALRFLMETLDEKDTNDQPAAGAAGEAEQGEDAPGSEAGRAPHPSAPQ